MLNRSVIPWGLMLVVGVILVLSGFTNRFGSVLAAFLAPSQLVAADSNGAIPPPAPAPGS